MMRALRIAAALCVLAAPSVALAADDDGTAPPAGITPAGNITLARVLATHRTVLGHLTTKKDTRVEDWNVDFAGVTGTKHEVFSGNDWRVDITRHTLHNAYGSLGGHEWNQNFTGEVVSVRGIHHADDISLAALNASHTPAGVTLLGRVTKPMPAYVVKVNPAGGRLEYVYFDATTFLIDRVESAIPGHRQVTTYDDFRTTDGATRAWHIHETDGDNDTDQRLQSVQHGVAVDPASLAMPASRNPVSIDGQTATLPAKIMDDRVIVTVTIKDRPVNLQLDSGASGIVLNQSVADALGLLQIGGFTGETAGKYHSRHAIIPEMTVGDVTAQNLIVETAPFEEWENEKTPVAGLLGFDFIYGSVLHIDYLNGTLKAIDPAIFVPPANAKVIPISLDENVPIVSATIGSSLADTFILDTGADRSTLFSAFVTSHPKDTADQGLGKEMQATFPFVTRFQGVGGSVKFRETQIAPFVFGGLTFPQWLFGATYDSPAFDFEDYAGLIGQDVLRNFDVYLDYQHLKIYLVPNTRYDDRWGR